MRQFVIARSSPPTRSDFARKRSGALCAPSVDFSRAGHAGADRPPHRGEVEFRIYPMLLLSASAIAVADRARRSVLARAIVSAESRRSWRSSRFRSIWALLLWPCLSAFEVQRILPASVRGPVDFFHGCKDRSSAACRARRSRDQPNLLRRRIGRTQADVWGGSSKCLRMMGNFLLQ